MIKKVIALFIVFGLAVADPTAKVLATSHDMVVVKPDTSSLVLDIITTLIGYKASALTLAVGCIDWLVSNSLIIVFGTIASLGLCKLTNKCNLVYKKYEEFAPVVHLRNLVTPEHLETAEQFLVSAVEKYAEERKSRRLRSMN